MNFINYICIRFNIKFINTNIDMNKLENVC